MNKELEKELKETIGKIQGSINILRSSPVILAYNKLVGINQKLTMLLSNLEIGACDPEVTCKDTDKETNEGNSN